MNPSLLFSIIIAILVADFLFELWLDFINYRHHSTHIPDELKGIYDEEQIELIMNSLLTIRLLLH